MPAHGYAKKNDGAIYIYYYFGFNSARNAISCLRVCDALKHMQPWLFSTARWIMQTFLKKIHDDFYGAPRNISVGVIYRDFNYARFEVLIILFSEKTGAR